MEAIDKINFESTSNKK